jgi:hypothetical protein
VGSPRLASALGLAAAIVLATGVGVLGTRSQGGPSAPGPVFQVAEAAEAAEVRPASAVIEASRASARPRPRPAVPRVQHPPVRKAAHPPVRKAAHPPARRTAPPSIRGWAYWAPRIRQCESSGNYRAKSPTSSASGGYQILDSTWQGRFGVRHASDATPAQQDQAAEELYRRHGTALWTASAACWKA